MNKCRGCGITLQNKDANLLGYTKDLTNKYCERCFKTIHYNIERKVNNIDNEKIIAKINKLGYYTIFLTDFLSINAKLIAVFKSIHNPKALVINKCDLIPDNLKLEHLEINLKKVYDIENPIFFISAKNKMYLERINSIIATFEKVIFCGETSSGKSTLINMITNSNLTTSKYNNTTLDFIKIKKDNYLIYDTPGLFITKQGYDKIKVVIKKLSNDFTLTIGNLKLRGQGNLTCFLASDIPVFSKKEVVNLNKELTIKKASDLILEKGFIFSKGNAQIKINRDIEIRDSIIK